MGKFWVVRTFWYYFFPRKYWAYWVKEWDKSRNVRCRIITSLDDVEKWLDG